MDAEAIGHSDWLYKFRRQVMRDYVRSWRGMMESPHARLSFLRLFNKTLFLTYLSIPSILPPPMETTPKTVRSLEQRIVKTSDQPTNLLVLIGKASNIIISVGYEGTH
ncbi:hypothetical protein M758_5G074600 [Ceratodon purpureus]|nr:hypothetical protein M758_5G074600 [Ceratodon purpureus]